MEAKVFLVNEVTDGMIPVKANLTTKGELVKISLPEQMITICVKVNDLRRIEEQP